MANTDLFPVEFSLVYDNMMVKPKYIEWISPHSIGSTTGASYFCAPLPLSDYLFTFVLDGKYLFSSDNSATLNVSCKKNSLIIFKPGSRFAVKGLTKNSHRIWLHISGKIIPTIMEDLNISDKHIVEFSDEQFYSIINKFANLRTVSLLQKKNSISIINSALRFLEEFDKNETLKNVSLSSALENVHNYITENFASKITISDLSKFSNISETHLIRNFKKKYEITPHQLILSLRLSSAAHYLQHTDISIEEIAIICGFNDRVHFSYAFTKKYGMSPTEYRHKYRRYEP